MKKKGKKRNKKESASKPSISLCMIVKNEEEFLPQCLESVKDYVDEMIVVDTGSTDRTVEIAESYGARIYHHPWENDFSKHRNQSLYYATGDWILIIDADEELEAKTSHLIRPLIRKAKTGVISFNVRSYLEDGAYYSEGSSPRLFKNGLGIHYRGRVHNQIIFKDTPTPSPVVLWHYGYDLDPEKKKAKVERSLTLLRQQVAEWTDDIPTRHHLAMTLMANKELEEAYQEAARTLEMARVKGVRSSQLAWTYFVAATSLLHMENYEEAEVIGQEGVGFFDWSIDLHHTLTQIYFAKKDFEKLLIHGNIFLDLCEKLTTDIGAFPLFQFETVHRDWIIYRGMGYAHIYLGRLEQGIEFLEKAVKNVSKNERFQFLEEIGLNLLKIGQKDKAVSMLEMLPVEQAGLAKGGRALARAYEESGRKQEAVAVYQKLKDALPEDPEIPFSMGLLLLELLDYAGASEAFEAAAGKAPDHAEAFINWGLALQKQGFFDKAEEKYRAALEIDPDSPMGNLNLGLFYFKDKDYLKSKDYLDRASSYFPENVYLQLALSRSYVEASEIEAMVGICEKVLMILDLPADLLIESISQVAELFIGIAEKLLREKKFESFDIALDIAKHLSPESTDGLKRLSRLAFDISEWERGADILETALAVDPKDTEILGLIQANIKELEG